MLPRLLVLLTVAGPCISLKSYNGWSVIRATPSNEQQLAYLNSLCVNDSSTGVEIWLQGGLNKPYDIFVSPDKKGPIVGKLEELDIAYNITEQNIQRSIDAERASATAGHRFAGELNNSTWFTKFLNLDEINQVIEKLSNDYPNLVKTETIGKTHEGRKLTVVTVSSNDSSTKPGIWIDGGIHAREWISPATVLFILNNLVIEYSSKSTIKNYVDGATFYILPVLNPDGYNFAFTKDRMWRKNRRPKQCDGDECCEGADLNRNFDHDFGGASTSPDSCSSIFPGPSAFSEPESRAVRDFLTNHTNVKAYISLHSYSQMWFFPYGSKRDFYPPDVKELQAVANKGAQAIESLYGTKFEVGSAADILYPSGGGSDDWAKREAGIKYSYTLELRPGRNYPGRGFILPPSEILPAGEEIFAGLCAVFDAVTGVGSD